MTVLAFQCLGQVPGYFNSKDLVSEEKLSLDVGFLSDSLCAGRASGSAGCVEAGFWIARRFENTGLVPFEGNYFSSFAVQNGICRNVIGMLPANPEASTGKYIIVGAHYDNLGILEGQIYPGADSNASGVAALLAISDLFVARGESGRKLRYNVIFAAFDGKQMSLAGSYDLCGRIKRGEIVNPVTGKTIEKKDIAAMVNLDILGGTASTIHDGREDFLLMLGGNNDLNQMLFRLNRNHRYYLDLCTDYYGSAGFTDLFLNRVSDQRAFREEGIRSLMFTSGITMDTNRTTDTPKRINFQVFKSRVCFIFDYICEIMLLQ